MIDFKKFHSAFYANLENKEMRGFWLEFCRLSGLIIFWVGVLCLLYFWPLALCLLAASFFIYPASFYAVFRISNLFTELLRIGCIASLFVLPLYGWYRSSIGDPLVDLNQRASEEVLAYQKEVAMKRYLDNKAFIIKGIKRYIEEGNYRFAYAHADEFMYTNDPELVELHEFAKKKMIEKGEFKEEQNENESMENYEE